MTTERTVLTVQQWIKTSFLGWLAGIPDAGYFMQTLYGPNAGSANNGCFQLDAFDRLYERTLGMSDGPQRRAAYRELQRLVEYNAGWVIGNTRWRNQLYQPWVIGYRKHPVLHADFMYLDIDTALRARAGTR